MSVAAQLVYCHITQNKLWSIHFLTSFVLELFQDLFIAVTVQGEKITVLFGMVSMGLFSLF